MKALVIFTIENGPMSLGTSKANAARLLEETAQGFVFIKHPDTMTLSFILLLPAVG